jgi:hypothetical protein
VVLVDQLDVAAARAIQYARTLTPDELRVVHFSVDPKRASALRQEWTELGLSRVPLDIIQCPDRRLTRGVVDLVAEVLADGETEVSVLIPRIEYDRAWHKLLHDRTSKTIAAALADFPHANVTFIPYHLGRSRRKKVARMPNLTDRMEASALPSGVVAPTDAVPITQLQHRQRVTVAGRIKQVRVQPRAGIATLQATLADGTGEVQIVFLGRRHIAGIVPGACLAVTGMVGEHTGRLEILNPDYNLLAPAEE